jgi:putative protease
VPGTSSSKRGVLLGTVRRVERDHRGGQRVLVELAASVKRGDGVMFDCSEKEDERQGGRVYEVFRDGRSVEEPVARGIAALAFAREAIDWRRIEPGQQLWKTDDPELTGRLRKSFTRRTPVDLTIEAAVGSPLRVRAVAVSGESCWVESEESLAAAMKHALSADVLREQFGRLGGSPYELRELDARIEGEPMAPLSVIGKMRREMLRLLDEAAATPPVRRIAEEAMLPRLREAAVSDSCRRRVLLPTDADRRKDSPPTVDAPPTIRVLCRSLAQLDAVRACGVGECYADFQDIREYGEAVKRAHTAGAKLFLATPRIQKPDEMGIFRALAKHGADGMLVRNLAGLEFYASRGVDVVADFSLNATNELSAAWLRARGATRLTASYDLNRDQLLDLVAAVPAAWLEIVVHQHMPMFHMEHCVFCAVLSPGTDKTNCGRPCDRHVVHLRDHIGMEHPLTADVGCRNTLFNAVPQSAAEVVPALLERGVRHFRIELLDDAPDSIGRTLDLYQQLLAGRQTGKHVWTQLHAANRVGVTRGTLEERRNPLAIL